MQLHEKLETITKTDDVSKSDIVNEAAAAISEAGYSLVEQDDTRPWGAFFRLANTDADDFVSEFFPGLDPVEARLGDASAELSPKILLVSPEQRLSWQRHDRRAERWAFITPGGNHKSLTDEQGNLHIAENGEIVQFAQGERHRLVGAVGHYTLVAEIWQHVDPVQPSDEADIVRLQDDYSR
jgi:mannose-6-phosphate isomerase